MKTISLTNLTDEQYEYLKEEAKNKGMTITGLIKHWCETKMKGKENKKK